MNNPLPAKTSDNGVGYKRPLVHSQFKPGQSGIPSGRPKGSQNLKTLFHKIMKEQTGQFDEPHGDFGKAFDFCRAEGSSPTAIVTPVDSAVFASGKAGVAGPRSSSDRLGARHEAEQNQSCDGCDGSLRYQRYARAHARTREDIPKEPDTSVTRDAKGGPPPARRMLGRKSPERNETEAIKRYAWRDQGILVVRADDRRLTWPERELVRQLGSKLYGRTPRDGR